MSVLQIKRGTAAKVALYVPVEGELVLDLDSKKLLVGDGKTTGGNQIVGAAPESVNHAKKADAAGVADRLRTPRKIAITGAAVGSATFDGSADAQIKLELAGLGKDNGIATLDGNGQVPSSQLPSYVDDVLEFKTIEDFPAVGETGKIFVELTGNTTWRWSGTTYVQIASGAVQSVNGKTGVVVLGKNEVGLGRVDNTPDKDKTVAAAGHLATARKIGGIAFNGTADIDLPGVNKQGNQNTTGNAATATKLAAARKINITGAFSGSANFDGSADASINVALSNIDLGTL
ncbi:hypothetical protein RZQ20_22025 [Raoultella ornithinolytica]|uniref:hyaluronate lyase N-terminal domain-containing protein n=1 Tax=Raoultella ornithinolytica TaxID=54291 RepID=UPI00292AA41C|nr:hypothetical protein [Raoultella ornithinolytica]MDV1094945.1 hypothetical protein [Raoultella ornithinolytica]MDV1122711.1 hypothetical protein [Raoultella ornithinolytica]MDV1893226.1 hypothetical protein [Raoultella ornithinolytica]